MADDSDTISERDGMPVGHPAVDDISDVMSFKLQRLVAIAERAGDDWSERRFDLSLNEWRLLAAVQAKEPTRPSDVADFLLMDKSQLSRVIRQLRDRHLVRNTADPDDGRAVALKLTGKGRMLYDQIMEEVMRSSERLVSPLSPEEIEALNDMLDRLIDHSHHLLSARIAARRG